MEGIVLFGVNNIYTVEHGGNQYLCRIKGKVLDEEMEYYNPITVGDFVEIIPDKFTQNTGWITGRRDRKNALVRHNMKKDVPQVMAANIDTVVCVTSPKSPPFRPRFLDRMIISAASEEIGVIICINKCDLGMDSETEERLASYAKMGYRIIRTSAETGQGITELF
jgi:ribosome biogenesis GTPase / thiamine phosphate phosphatase